jgi:hypothetical protein
MHDLVAAHVTTHDVIAWHETRLFEVMGGTIHRRQHICTHYRSSLTFYIETADMIA